MPSPWPHRRPAIRREKFVKSACRRLLLALGALCCLHAAAAPYPTEAQLRSALSAGVDLLAAEGMASEPLDARQEGLALPLYAAGLDLKTGVCVVFFNTDPEASLKRFFAGLEARDMPLWLGAIAVHEATHCIEQRYAYLRQDFAKVLPGRIGHAGMTVQGYLSVVKSGKVETWGEALADIASLLYLKRTVPERWRQLAQGLAAMRRDFAAQWPEHDTSAWLDRIIAADAPAAPGLSIFEAAFELRRRFQPATESAGNDNLAPAGHDADNPVRPNKATAAQG